MSQEILWPPQEKNQEPAEEKPAKRPEASKQPKIETTPVDPAFANGLTQAYQPHDVAECPECARRFLGKSSLITLNKRFPAHNPVCTGIISYDDSEIKTYLDNFQVLTLWLTGVENVFTRVPNL